MVALLRCRRIAYRLLPSTTGAPGVAGSHAAAAATFYLPGPNGALQAVTGSTPQIRRFEAEFAGRALVPADPALARVDARLEDFGDGWLTKAMLHCRWTHPADIRKAGYRHVLLALEDHFRAHRFLMGARPGASDVPICGQLTQLVHVDPTSMALAAEIAPRVGAWVLTMEDLWGLEPADVDWLDATRLPDSLRALLPESGRLYAPLLQADAQALQAGQTELQASIDGQPWVLQVFPHQGNRLAWLRRDCEALSAADRARADAAWAGSGCEALFIL